MKIANQEEHNNALQRVAEVKKRSLRLKRIRVILKLKSLF